jgi:hypothetical protein
MPEVERGVTPVEAKRAARLRIQLHKLLPTPPHLQTPRVGIPADRSSLGIRPPDALYSRVATGYNEGIAVRSLDCSTPRALGNVSVRPGVTNIRDNSAPSLLRAPAGRTTRGEWRACATQQLSRPRPSINDEPSCRSARTALPWNGASDTVRRDNGRTVAAGGSRLPSAERCTREISDVGTKTCGRYSAVGRTLTSDEQSQASGNECSH